MNNVIKDFFENRKKEKVFEVSKNFEQKTLEAKEKINKLTYVIGGTGVLFGVLSMIALIALLPLKQTNVEVFTVDAQTGRTEKITTVKKEQVTQDAALSKFFVSSYIKYRESYNYFRLQQDYDATLIMGSPDVNQEYIDYMNSDFSPMKKYNNADHTVKVEMLSINISNSSNPDDPAMFAIVRFKKIIKAVASRETKEEYFTARLTYQYFPEKEMTEEQRELSPLGFTITSYQPEKDLRGES
ncbi:type IV secretion system protein [Salmonella enterica]|nr:type IV secretion system protein [Salmonella enterica]